MPKGVRRTADERLAEIEAEELRLEKELKEARELRKTLRAEAAARKALEQEKENIELGALLRELVTLDEAIRARVLHALRSRQLSGSQREVFERVLGPVAPTGADAPPPASHPASTAPDAVSSQLMPDASPALASPSAAA